MASREWVKNTTHPNIEGVVVWPASVDAVDAVYTAFTGEWENYDSNNPFNGAASLVSLTITTQSVSASVQYDVFGADTATVGTYRVHLHVLFDNGEEEIIPTIVLAKVVDTV